MPRIAPLSFKCGMLPGTPNGISHSQMEGMRDVLNACRDAVLTDNATFTEMPEQMLDMYQSDRGASELGRMLATAKRIGGLVDKVIVLGSDEACAGAKALMESCCHPFHNHLSRSERGGRPRMFFHERGFENDWAQALLEFLDLETKRKVNGPEEKWAIVSIAHRDDGSELTDAIKAFASRLASLVGREHLARYVVSVVDQSTERPHLCDAVTCNDRFQIHHGIDGSFSILSAAGLLPAAMLGVDVVKLLEAAAVMNTHFLTEPLGRNVIMDFVATHHLLQNDSGAQVRPQARWSTPNKSFAAVGIWHAHLQAPPSRLDHTRSARAPLAMTRVIVDSHRYPPNPPAVLPVMDVANHGTNLASRDSGLPKTELRLPTADEASMGQFFQMMMLASILESKLVEATATGM